MSELEPDRENQNDEKAKLVNFSGNETNPIRDNAKAKKKKILFIGIGLLILIGVILAIVLPLTLKKDDGGGGGGGGGEDPFSVQEYNPYTVDQGNVTFSTYKGDLIIRTQNPLPQAHSPEPVSVRLQRLRQKLGATNEEYKPIDPSNVKTAFDNPKNFNNFGTDEVSFNVSMVDNFNVRIIIQDNHNPGVRNVSSDVFARPVLSWEARLTQVGFNMSNESFAFGFNNIYTKNKILTTEKRKLVVTDKFSEIGFVLPTQRCFGLGQRNNQFQLQYGAYTLFAKHRENGLEKDDGLGDKNGNHIHPFVVCQT